MSRAAKNSFAAFLVWGHALSICHSTSLRPLGLDHQRSPVCRIKMKKWLSSAGAFSTAMHLLGVKATRSMVFFSEMDLLRHPVGS